MTRILNVGCVVCLMSLVLGCAGGVATLKEPEEGKNLLIGSILFENSGYQNRNEIFTDRIEVAVIGYYQENGKEKLLGKWLVTDENGYFFIPNVPDGRYALKGLRINLSGRALLTIAKNFRTTVDNYEIQPSETIAFSGTHFDTEPINRIVDLKHNHFQIFQNMEIRHGAYDVITGFTAATGENVERPFIHEYFIEKFPESGWKEYLEKDLKRLK